MIMSKLLYLVISLVVLATMVNGAIESEPDNDPRIDPDEIKYPSFDYNEWKTNGQSPPWYEDVNSLNCESARRWCNQVDNETKGV